MKIKTALLQFYRLAILLAIAWLIRNHHDRLRIQGGWPITVAEVRVFLPDAYKLRVDKGARKGLFVLDRAKEEIGYVVRTMPHCREIVGYSGPTDSLVVFDAGDKGVGMAIRHSYDTPSHVEDVQLEFLFMESWNGRTWEEIAEIEDLNEAQIYTVSGASRTSEAVALSINHRISMSVAGGNERPLKLRFDWKFSALMAFLFGGLLFAYIKKESIQRWRPLYSVATIVGLGFWMGDLIAQSLLVGWAESRIPWESTPGLIVFVATAFFVPWYSGQPVYCQFICPHGNLQRWFMKIVPAKWKRPLTPDAKWIGRLVPVMLLVIVIAASFLQLDFDLAGIEPFDAYLIKSAGAATITVAIVGLLISLFFPMAYCKYGCPTGWLLEFVRRRTGKDRFSGRDWAGLGLLGIALILFFTPLEKIIG